MNLFDPITIVIFVILIYSAILHEIAHGFVAERLGDPTARLLGRITLDPRPHIDLYMTILLPLFMILSHLGFVLGGAKPVPVDPFNLRDGRKDLALVSLAGPLTNLSIAGFFSVVLHLLFPHSTTLSAGSSILYYILLLTVHMNIGLAIFNLLPIPPLDGSKVFSLLLPPQLANQYLALGNLGPILLIILLMLPLGGFSLFDLISTLSCSVLSLLQLPC